MGKADTHPAEKASAVVLIAFGFFVAWYSHHYLKLGRMIIPGAGFLPFCIGIVLVVLGAAWYARTLLLRRKLPAAGEPERSVIVHRLLPGVLLVVLYAWLFEKAGYIASTVLFMVGWQKLVEREGWVKTAIVAATSAAFMYVLFARFLRVFLPSGSWWS
ncbi:MAG: tripartite tricarboxylate transporter TctB family protein [Deltaproteobacteria bacterium]|nr:tripartite tricarboxylate transporter TctB family protein [Deltaproteobacteria bacterium]